MKLWEKLISDDLNTVSEGVKEFVNRVVDRPKKQYARIADRYYEIEHDILNKRIFYMDAHGQLVEDTMAANNQIPHGFFTEQIDQKVQYLLSKGITFKTENQKLEERLKDYIDEDFQLFANEIVEGASKRGAEYAYARTDANDRLRFQTSNLLTTDTVLDDNFEEVAVIRRYTDVVWKDDKETSVTYAEVYTDENVSFFVSEDNKPFVPDESIEINPRPHVVGVTDDGETISRNYGRIPFYRLSNNRNETSDLKPIKALIDDYDMMSSFLSNNLQDYDKPIYVVTGFKGENMKELREKIKMNGAVSLGAPNGEGSLDLKTYNIPYEARKVKMELDKENIYKFGMGFDSSQSGGSNITNIEIKSRYSLLDLKCNKIEPRLRGLLKWCLELILQDIQRLHNETYDINEVEIIIERNTIFNDTDTANRENIQAQTEQVRLQSLLLIAPRIGDIATLEKICEELELDFDEVLQALQEADLGLDVGVDYDEEAQQMAD